MTELSSPPEAPAPQVEQDRPHLPLPTALRSLARCVARTGVLLVRRRIRQPGDHLDSVLHFGDGTRGRVYRETVVTNPATDAPVLLVVCFRLRWIGGRGHALFRAESLFNTPLFAGFPGFVSKLWLAHDEHGVYRGVYQWNGAALAHAYAGALWWVLALVSDRRSIHYVVVPGLRRDDVLADPTVLDGLDTHEPAAWWRITAVERRGA